MPAHLPAPVSWEPWPARLESPALAVFRYHLNTADQPWLACLVLPDEQQKATRYRQLADQQRFIAGRGWLRWLAGQLTGTAPRQIQLTTGPFGKPEIATGTNWHVNVSHTGEWVLLAVGNVPVGVDVEVVNPEFAFQDMVATSFSAQEQAELALSTDPRCLFYTFWTRKESLLKATGQGMVDDLALISVSKEGQQEFDGGPIGSGTWSTVSFAVADGYVGAVTCKGSPMAVRFFTLETPVLGSSVLNIAQVSRDVSGL